MTSTDHGGLHMEHIKLAIKPNTCNGVELCALCGKKTEPQTPFDLFLNETPQLVCKACGEKHAPELVSLLDYFYKGHYVEPEYETIEKEVNDIKRTADNLQTENLPRLEQDLIKLSKRSYVLKKFITRKLREEKAP